MKLSFDKSGLILVFISIIGILFQTSGFDFYAHALSHSFDVLKYPLNRGFLIGEKIFLPRYLLLSDIYQLFSLTPIPLGWILSFFVIYPSYQIGKSSYYKSLKSEKLFVQFLIFCFSFLYSGTNVGLLWIIAFFATNNYFFLIGILFHPVCVSLIILITFISLIKREKKPIFFCLILLIIYIIIVRIKSDLGIPYDISEYPLRGVLTLKTTWALALYTLTNSKSKLLVILVFMFLVFILSLKNIRLIFSNLANTYFLKRILSFPIFWSFFISFLLINSIEKKTLINSIYSYKQLPLPMEITWFSKNKLKDFDHFDLINKKRQNTTY